MTRTIINIALILISLLFADKAYNTFTAQPDTAVYQVPSGGGEGVASPKAARIDQLADNPSKVIAFSVIHDKDLFRMEREEYIPPEMPEAEEIIVEPVIQVVEKPSLILHGVINLGDKSIALIEDLKASPELAGSKKYKTGDIIYGFKITKILSDRVVIKKDDTSYDVLLYDRKKLAKSGRKPVKRPRKRVVKEVTIEKSKDEKAKEILDEERKKQLRLDAVQRLFGVRPRKK